MTKTEFLLTILVQNQENKWQEPRKVYIRLLLVDPIPNSQTWGLQVTFSNDVDYCEIARKAGFQVFYHFSPHHNMYFYSAFHKFNMYTPYFSFYMYHVSSAFPLSASLHSPLIVNCTMCLEKPNARDIP